MSGAVSNQAMSPSMIVDEIRGADKPSVSPHFSVHSGRSKVWRQRMVTPLVALPSPASVLSVPGPPR